MRFDDRVTGNIETYAPHASKIHIDIDAAEIGKNVPVDVGLVGDLKEVLERILEGLEADSHAGWLQIIGDGQADERARDAVHSGHHGKGLLAAEVMHALWELTDGESVNVTDVGQHQMVEAQYYPHRRPHTLVTSGGMGTMGFGVPAAIGAKMGCPEEEVWAIVGDGGFQMTMAELATAMQEKVEIKIALINNGFLGMVRQWQEFFYDERYESTPMLSPDFCKLAAAFEIPAVRVDCHEAIETAVRRAQEHRGGPFLIEFVVEPHDVVYPMVPAGADLHEMIRRPRPKPRSV
jgi:acetolactate synthase-1/2/3 large subunit